MGKRFWQGMCLLLILLGVGLWARHYTQNHHTDIAHKLTQAAQAFGEGALEEGQALVRQAQSAWENARGVTAAIAEHTPLEEVDDYFAFLDPILDKAGPAIAGCLSQLSEMVRSIPMAHDFSWENLF